MITTELKNKILAAMAAARENFTGSDAKFALSIGINNAQYSRIKKGELDRVISDAVWISLARRFDVRLNNAPEWKVTNTPVFQFITAQLSVCQEQGLSSMLCDLSDIGKTFTALHYARTHRNAVYVDCSQVKSKQKLIRFIAKSFGVGHSGKYADVYEDLVFFLKTLPTPLVILDEAGDLDYPAFLELKALWNATEHFCGFYMMGADGLEAKIRRGIEYKKVGFTEIFSRFNKKYGKVVPVGKDERNNLLNASAAMIIRANCKEGTDVNMVLRQTLGDDDRPSLRRIFTKLTTAN